MSHSFTKASREMKASIRAGVEAVIAKAALDGLPKFMALDAIEDAVSDIYEEPANASVN